MAGALVGVVGAMVVRYWFAARRLGFAIGHDGAIIAAHGPSLGRLKRVARDGVRPIRSGRRNAGPNAATGRQANSNDEC